MTALLRPTPFTLLFGALAQDRFPAVREALERAGIAPADRDGFLLVREVAELLRELRPEEGLGDALSTWIALLHTAYRFWAAGEPVRPLDAATLAALAAASPPGSNLPVAGADTSYVQLPALTVWAAALPGRPPEPLDGWFVSRTQRQLSLFAILGLSPTRPGVTGVELAGPPPGRRTRPDGTALFAPELAGGPQAGLLSLADEAELLELAWREALR